MPLTARPRRPPAHPLADIASLLGTSLPPRDPTVTGVSQSTASVVPGDLFVAVPGARVHGARFVQQAIGDGAVAVLTDRAGAASMQHVDVPVLVVPDPRAVLGTVAAHVFGDPAAAITVIGVTGTQGKTTTTHLLYAGLRAVGVPVAVIGTLGTWIDGVKLDSRLTTPEAPELHGLFAVMRERGITVCAMEVSSHALVQRRVDGVAFDVAVFTNFGRDHLDFHRDEADYFAAKASLFTPERSRFGLLNGGDAAVRSLLIDPSIPLHTFGLEDAGGSENAADDWQATDVRSDVTGSSFVLHGPRGEAWDAETRLAGGFNVANAVAASAACGEAGLSVTDVVAGVGTVAGIPGRMERVDAGHPLSVVVDYAHKPDALRAVLGALRRPGSGRLWVVIGAGGDRDHGKRPLMGEVAAELADVVVVTDDNPRGEEPASIRRALLEGAARCASTELREIADRGEAISWVLDSAAPGDVVLVAGKGHEQGQEIDGEIHAFDDREVARRALALRFGGDR